MFAQLFEYFCELDQAIRTRMDFRSYKVQVLLRISSLQLQKKNTFIKFMIFFTQEAHQKVQKDESITLEGRTSHQKDHRCITRMNYPESYVQKGDDWKVTILEVPHPQSFLCTIQGSISKVKRDVTRSKRSTDKSKKLVNYQCYFSSSVELFTC